MHHDDYVRFMWDAAAVVLRHGKTPIVWEEAGVAKLPDGHDRPALVRRRSPRRPRPRRACR